MNIHISSENSPSHPIKVITVIPRSRVATYLFRVFRHVSLTLGISSRIAHTGTYVHTRSLQAALDIEKAGRVERECVRVNVSVSVSVSVAQESSADGKCFALLTWSTLCGLCLANIESWVGGGCSTRHDLDRTDTLE